MKVLVTGGTGYLGSHLVRRLLLEGHEVAAFRRRESSLTRLLDVSGDIAWYDADEGELSTPFKQHAGFDAVIHTATCYGRNGESPATIFAANTIFPVRLLEAASLFNTVTFFNTDTYFNADDIIPAYLKFYAISKKYFSEWGKNVVAQGSMRFVNIRLEHLYGPQDVPDKFTSHVLQQCMKNISSIALTPGEQLRDFIYVDDVIGAYNQLLQMQQELRSGYVDVGLGSGFAISVREFVERVHSLCNSTSHLDFGALPYREHEIMRSSADISLLLQIGWKQEVLLEAGIEAMIKAENDLE